MALAAQSQVIGFLISGGVTISDPSAQLAEKFGLVYAVPEYHQNYLTLHPDQPYIAFNDIPKVEGLKKLFPAQYRDKPVLVKVAS